MPELVLTKHAQARTQQRGLLNQDLELIGRYGHLVDDGILMTNKAVLKGRMKRLEKLKGRLIITDGSVVITTYRAKPKQIKALLRKN